MAKVNAVWLDEQYNNRALVPEFAEHFARWVEQSAQARKTQSFARDVAYGDGRNEALDVFPAISKPPKGGAPVLVFIHGGYWRSLDKSDHSFVAPAFIANGACVVVPNYALCPGDATHPVTISDITLQMVKALIWTYRNIARYGGDPQRITVVGHSAGGHLAAMLLACLWKQVEADLPVRLVKNALSISGLFELDSIRSTPFLQASLQLTPGQVRKNSPAWMASPGVVKNRGVLYSVAGANESSEFLRHNRLIQKAWGKRVVPVSEALPGLNHFSILEALIQPGHRLNQLAGDLLRS